MKAKVIFATNLLLGAGLLAFVLARYGSPALAILGADVSIPTLAAFAAAVASTIVSLSWRWGWILGGVCTRACAYCNVEHGQPGPIDRAEPARVAEAVRVLDLDYVVITSVDRDDVDDGGAAAFAATITAIRTLSPACGIETLVPDFGGRDTSLDTVLSAGPDVLNHNIETVRSQYRRARPGGRYDRALRLLDRAHRQLPAVPTKSGLMVGLGETWDELRETLADLRGVGCGILTIGQYLRPSAAHLPVARYYHPDEFATLKQAAVSLGFGHVESGPLVRSSYHAHEQAAAFSAGPPTRQAEEPPDAHA